MRKEKMKRKNFLKTVANNLRLFFLSKKYSDKMMCGYTRKKCTLLQVKYYEDGIWLKMKRPSGEIMTRLASYK